MTLTALVTCRAQCAEMVCLSSGNCQYKSKSVSSGSFSAPCDAGTDSGSAVSNCEMASERSQSKHSFSIWRGIGFFACSKSTLSFTTFKTSFHFRKSVVHVLPLDFLASAFLWRWLFLWRLLACAVHEQLPFQGPFLLFNCLLFSATIVRHIVPKSPVPICTARPLLHVYLDSI